jgi:proteasome-associated ATPase
MEQDQFIEQEVQRRLAQNMKRHNEQVAELTSIIADCQNSLIRQHGIIAKLASEPLCFGTLVKVHNSTDANRFSTDDELLVIDQESIHYGKGGKIISGLNNQPVVNDEGKVLVQLTDQVEEWFSVGIEGKGKAQIRLSQKDDGTYAVVSIDGKPWEVRGIPDFDLNPGDPVKVRPDSKQIVSRGYDLDTGIICRVISVSEDGVEVEDKGEKKLVLKPQFEVVAGDRVVVDPSYFIVVKKLPAESNQQYRLSTEMKVDWDQIGGLENAKNQCKEFLEMPFENPELFAHYGVQRDCGALFYGPPGCGKTLLARACASSLARIHGKSAAESGYIYVKGPELLDKWVGNTERKIRDLFEMARDHYKQFGYPAILAIDEADSIMPQRGTRRSSDVADTIVPMFLGEMDGIDENETKANPIVIIMTNRPDIIDPAVTRPGRISKHIKIDRPNEETAFDILQIHSRKTPFAPDTPIKETLIVTCADLFSKGRLLYRINGEHDFTLGDAVNGAMLASIAEIAKMNALWRDLKSGSKGTGVKLEDFRNAVQSMYDKQRGFNHAYDIHDFAESKGIQPSDVKVERCFGAA